MTRTVETGMCYEIAPKKETLSHAFINSKDFTDFHKGLKL